MVQLSHPYMTSGKIIALTLWTFVSKVMSLFFNTLKVCYRYIGRKAKYLRKNKEIEDQRKEFKNSSKMSKERNDRSYGLGYF